MKIDLTRKKFHGRKVICKAGKQNKDSVCWLFIYDYKAEATVNITDLRIEHQNCGCLYKNYVNQNLLKGGIFG